MERTMSMKSFDARSDGSRGNNMSLADIQALMATMGGRSRGTNRDDASDTSSQRERKFAAMLGDDGGLEYHASGGQGGPRNVGDRLFIVGCGKEKMKEERLREERDRQLMVEMAQMTQRPNITMRARTRPGKGPHFSEHAMLWEQRRREHQAELSRQRRLEVNREVSGTPSLDPHSRELVENRGHYTSPVSGWQEHFARFCAKRATPMSPENLFNPNINVNAVREAADVSIAERLYSEFSSRRERRQRAAEEAREKELLDPATGRPLFKPHSLTDRRTNRSVEELSQQLHDDRKQSEKKRAETEQYRDPEMTFRPQLNQTSAMLAAKSPRKPLYDPKRIEASANRSRSADAADVSPIHPRNVPATNVQEFLHRTQRADLGRAARIAAIKSAIEERETSECTFQPRINSKSEQIFQATNLSGAPLQSPMAVLSSPFQDPASMAAVSVLDSANRRAGSPRGGTTRLASSPTKLAPGFAKLQRTAASEMEAAMLAADVMPAAAQRSPASTQRASPSLPATSRSQQPSFRPAATTPSASPVPAELLGSARSAHGSGGNGGDGGGSPTQSQPAGSGGPGNVDHYIQAFERQMYAVLDEWRRLEEV